MTAKSNNVSFWANKLLHKDTPRQGYPACALGSISENFYAFSIYTGNNHSYYEKGVLYPDVTVDEVFQSMIKDEAGDLALVSFSILLINSGFIKSPVELTPIILMQFSLFHEEGHWLHYIKEYQDVNTKNYFDDYNSENKKSGIKDLTNKITFYRLKDLPTDDLAHEYCKLYRQHPFEIIADKYAIQKLKKLYH